MRPTWKFSDHPEAGHNEDEVEISQPAPAEPTQSEPSISGGKRKSRESHTDTNDVNASVTFGGARFDQVDSAGPV